MDAKDINRRLTNFGENSFSQPKWRLVWSDDQLEKRFGEFNEFYGKIFLRNFTGVMEVPKYPHIIHKWILERWMPPELAYHSDLPESNRGSYEPIYVFADKNNEPLPLNWRVCEIVVDSVENRPRPAETREVLQKYFDTEQAAEIAEYEAASDASRMASMLHGGSASGYGGKR